MKSYNESMNVNGKTLFSHSCKSLFLAGLVSVSLLTGIVHAQPSPSAPSSFAELTDKVMGAVVNISASTTYDQDTRNHPERPGEQPFDEMFDEFFKRRHGDSPIMPRRSSSLGSGFIIDSSGIVVTNNHVIGEANDVTVILQDGTKLKAEILGKDPKIDLAVLKVKSEKPLKSVPFGNSDELRAGDWVIAIGNPFGFGGTVTAGIVSARGRDIEMGPYDNYIQTDASINKGNSGGPLFNMKGEVIGINTAIFSPTGGSVGIGFAVPSNSALPVINQLKDFGETRRGFLGVRIQPIDEESAEALKLPNTKGALVANVEKDGPAQKGGLETGDVIIRFNGKDVKNARDLSRIVAETDVNKAVEVVIIRKGQEVSKQVTLGRLEDEQSNTTLRSNSSATPSQKEDVLGMSVSTLSSPLRKRFRIKDSISGVLVTNVDPKSAAAEKRIFPGDVIMEVAQEAVKSPEDILKKIEAAKRDGRKSILILISTSRSDGDTRFIALPLNSKNK